MGRPAAELVFPAHNMPDELSGFEECFISDTGAGITPASGAGPCNFTPGAIFRALIDDDSAEVRPQQKAA